MENTNVYRKLYLMRQAESILAENYASNDIKTPLHLGEGAEAIVLAVLNAAPPERKIYGTYRSHNIFLAETGELDLFMGEMYGRTTGVFRGRAGSMHLAHPEKNLMLTSAVVATTIPVAAGHALAIQLQNLKQRVIVFFGDGAIEEGVFWETLNFAVLRNLPITFVCEDNDLAIHSSKKERQGFKIHEAIRGAGCPYYFSEANEYQTLEATAAKSFKDSSGPTFLHFSYVRLKEHVGITEDWSAGYRQPPKNLEQADPVLKYRNYLLAHGTAELEIKKIEDVIDLELATALNKAKAAPKPQADELLKFVYAEGGSL